MQSQPQERKTENANWDRMKMMTLTTIRLTSLTKARVGSTVSMLTSYAGRLNLVCIRRIIPEGRDSEGKWERATLYKKLWVGGEG